MTTARWSWIFFDNEPFGGDFSSPPKFFLFFTNFFDRFLRILLKKKKKRFLGFKRFASFLISKNIDKNRCIFTIMHVQYH